MTEINALRLKELLNLGILDLAADGSLLLGKSYREFVSDAEFNVDDISTLKLSDRPLKEQLYCKLYGITEPPSCLQCDTPAPFISMATGYRQFCSERCQSNFSDKPEIIQDPAPIIFRDTTVKVVTSTRASDIHVKAWVYSRPNIDSADSVEVLSIDAPVNEIGSLTLQMYVPVIVRDVVTACRDHSMWAMTSRVTNILHGMELPTFLAGSLDIEGYELIVPEMQKSADEGVMQDQYRMELPILSMSGFTVTFSIRTWIKLLKYFVYLGNKSEVSGLTTLYYTVGAKIADCLSQVLELDLETLDSIAKGYSLVNFLTPLSTKYLDDSADDNYAQIYTSIQYATYAQLIRHRNVFVTSNLEEVFTSKEAFDIKFGSNIIVGISATKDTWSSITKKRNCWMAQNEIWADILSQLSDASGDLVLPCSGKTECPYAGDAEQRYIGTDPGIPCPKYHALHHLDHKLKPKETKKYFDYVQSTGRPFVWNSIIKDITEDYSV